MPEKIFTERDMEKIREYGLTPNDLLSQLEMLRGETIPMRLARACSVGDGIIKINKTEICGLISRHNQAAGQGRMTKFVPASGAASRMFQGWFKWYETKDFNATADAAVFEKQFPGYAFYDDLSRSVSLQGLNVCATLRDNPQKILEYILTPKGLNYANIPKALLKFHTYQDRSRTAIEEHLVEAIQYVRDESHICRMHFTVSEEHRCDVETYLKKVRGHYEKNYDTVFNIDISVQHPSTNTIALGSDGRPFRDETGEILLRPGGHGSLLKNLGSVEGDIIFVKNIDNVAPDRLKPEAVTYKKVIGGYLIRLQEEVFDCIKRIKNGEPDENELLKMADFCRESLFRALPMDFHNFTDTRKKTILFDILNRPLRVCGMVKNEGEPGGGPFWVEEPDGSRSLQIIEKMQINMEYKRQSAIWESSTYFNPVDLVCAIRDYRDEKFDLERYVNEKAWTISRKSHEEKPIKIIERPGLWNGSMSGWNTVFIEVPSSTFSPVKTVEDLLRDEHRALSTHR